MFKRCKSWEKGKERCPSIKYTFQTKYKTHIFLINSAFDALLLLHVNKTYVTIFVHLIVMTNYTKLILQAFVPRRLSERITMYCILLWRQFSVRSASSPQKNLQIFYLILIKKGDVSSDFQGLGRVTTHQSPLCNAPEPSQFYSKLKKEIFFNNKSLGKENSFN